MDRLIFILHLLLFVQVFAQQEHIPQSNADLAKPIDCPEVPYTRQPHDPCLIINLDVQPEYPRGLEVFRAEVLKGVDTSDNGAPSGYKVRTYLRFIIEEDGTLSNFTLHKDPGFRLGEEVIEAAKKTSQRWKPGVKDGKVIRVGYVIPILIVIL